MHFICKEMGLIVNSMANNHVLCVRSSFLAPVLRILQEKEETILAVEETKVAASESLVFGTPDQIKLIK